MKKFKILCILMLNIVLGFFVGYSLHYFIHQIRFPEQTVLVLPEHPHYLLEDVNEEILYKTLVHYEFPSPEIITAQAILETGNFQSKLCKDKNNLFGLYNSRTLNYYQFDSWISCVFAYKKYILDGRYDGKKDYYQHLQDIGYASDTLYISKVKSIAEKIELEYEKTYQQTDSIYARESD